MWGLPESHCTQREQSRVPPVSLRPAIRIVLLTLVLAAGSGLQAQTPDHGVFVVSVDPASAAARAGLKTGHRIVEVNKVGIESASVNTPLELHAAINSASQPAGATLIVEDSTGILSLVLPVGSFLLESRPAFDKATNKIVDTAMEAARRGDPAPVAALAEHFARAHRPDQAAWLLVEAATAIIRFGHSALLPRLLTQLEPLFSTAPDGQPIRAQGLLELGEALYEAGDLKRSAALLEQALATVEQTHPGSRLHAGILHAHGRTLIYQGATDDARELFDTGFSLSDRAGDAYFRVVGRERQGFGELWIYDNKTALATLDAALVQARAMEPGGTAEIEILLRLALLHRQMRELPQAQAHATAALEQTGIDGRPLQQARAWFELGVIKSMDYRLREAETHQRDVLELLEVVHPAANLRLYALNSLGYMSQVRGDFEAAYRYYAQALSVFEANGAWPDAAIALQNIAYNAIDLRDYDLAESAGHRARALQDKAGYNAGGLVTIDVVLAQAALESGRLDDAEERYQQVEELLRSAPANAWDRWDVLYSRGLISLQRNMPKEAIGFFDQALAITRSKAPGTVYVALPEFDKGRALEILGLPDRAHIQYARAIEAYETSQAMLGGGLHEHGTFLGRWARFYQQMITLETRLGRIDEAFATLEQYRSRLLQNLVIAGDGRLPLQMTSETAAEISRERLHHDEVLERLRDPADAEGSQDHGQLIIALDASRARLATLQSAVTAEVTLERLAGIGITAAIDVDHFRQSLPRDTVLLSYAVTEERTHLFCIARESSRVVTIDAGRAAISSLVDSLRTLLSVQRPDEAIQAATVNALHNAWRVLMAPAANCLKTKSKLIILADGALHALPFAALVTELPARPGERPTHALDHFTISGALSASHILAAQSQSGEHRRTPPSSVALLAFDPAQANGNVPSELATPNLPGVEAEARTIATLFGDNVQVRIGADATETAARQLSGSSRIVHFATHAQLNETRPMDSWLQFAAGAADDNGLLQAWEIAAFLRLDADLVTLSACETLVGRDYGGTGLIGMHSAFFYAGAHNVLGTLWRVEDQAAAEIMGTFYDGFAKGLAPADALREAQRNHLDRAYANVTSTHWLDRFTGWLGSDRSSAIEIVPYARWAAFQLSGRGL